MSKIRLYAKNLTFSWFAYAANVGVMFFLTPFVVHCLGNAQYGVWTSLASITGYLGLVELGVQAALGRHVIYYLGRQDVRKANQFINTSLAFFLVAGIPILLAAGTLALFFGTFFAKVPAGLVPTAQVVILLVALNLWATLLISAFNQTLIAHERFDLLKAINIGTLTIRTAATVVVLVLGWGLVGLAGVQLLTNLACGAATFLTVPRIFPAFRLHPRLVSGQRFRELFSFGVWAFIGNLSWRLIFFTGTTVIFVLLPPDQVTFYVIGSMLLFYGQDILLDSASVFSPQIIRDCATQNWESIRNTFRQGQAIVMTMGIGMLVGFILFGKEFITLWMGPNFHTSYTILLILSLSQLPAIAMMLGGPMYFGLNRPRLGALLMLGQGLANLALSVALVSVWGMGIEGVAWGTFYPRLVFSLVGGLIALRWMRFPLWTFARTLCLRWTVVAGVFALVSYGANALLGHGHWPLFFTKVVLCSLLYLPIVWWMMLTADDRLRFRTLLVTRLPHPWGWTAPEETSDHAS